MRFRALVFVFGIIMASANTALAAEPQPASVGFSAGVFEVFDRPQAEFSVDLRFSGKGRWQPRLIGTWAKGGATFAGAGLLLHATPAEGWNFAIGFAPGYYERKRGPRLGSRLEFFSTIEISRDLGRGRRLGLSIGHMSNGSLGDSNPGTETVSIFWLLPFGR
jgi:lipid A 3-O-deacylase